MDGSSSAIMFCVTLIPRSSDCGRQHPEIFFLIFWGVTHLHTHKSTDRCVCGENSEYCKRQSPNATLMYSSSLLLLLLLLLKQSLNVCLRVLFVPQQPLCFILFISTHYLYLSAHIYIIFPPLLIFFPLLSNICIVFICLFVCWGGTQSILHRTFCDCVTSHHPVCFGGRCGWVRDSAFSRHELLFGGSLHYFCSRRVGWTLLRRALLQNNSQVNWFNSAFSTVFSTFRERVNTPQQHPSPRC